MEPDNRSEILARAVTEGRIPSGEEALLLYETPQEGLLDLLSAAHKIKIKNKGLGVNLCSIVNAKSGRCPEDCKFCAQSAHYPTDIDVYPLLSPAEITAAARAAGASGAKEFSIVTSGKGIKGEKELASLKDSIASIIRDGIIAPCASLGILEAGVLAELKEAGLAKYHHNLETSRNFFPRICSTHDYQEDVLTVKTAKGLGFYVCSGGIFGLGESRQDRIDLALTLAELEVDSVPMNFLNPIKNTPLADLPRIGPLEILKTVAIYRLILPEKDIVICGGRNTGLRELHPLVLLAGANGLLTGNYLTTQGRDPACDRQMIADLGLEVSRTNE